VTRTIRILFLAAALILPAPGAHSALFPFQGDEVGLTPPDEEASRKEVLDQIEENKEEAAKLKAEFVDQLGVDESEYSCCISDHVVLLAKVEEEQAVQLTQIAEYVYRRLNWITFGKTEADTFKPAGGKHHYYMVDKDSYEDLLVWLSEKFPRTLTKQLVRYYLKIADKVGGASLALAHPPMHFNKGRNRSSAAANGMGHHWLAWNTRSALREINIRTGKPMGRGRDRQDLLSWLHEGVGIWASLDAIGLNNYFRITQTRYSNVGRAKKGGDSDYVALAYELATGQIGRKDGAKNFYQLTRADLNQLSDLDLAMSWSIVDYLLRSRTKEWRDLIKRCNRVPSFRIAMVGAFGTKQEKDELKVLLKKTKNQNRLDELYRMVCERFEKGWKAWVAEHYRGQYEDPTKTDREPPFTPIETAVSEDGNDEGGGEEKPKKKKKKKKKRRRRRR